MSDIKDGVCVNHFIKMPDSVDGKGIIYRNSKLVTTETFIFLNGNQIASAEDFERVKTQLARLDDVEGLAGAIHHHDDKVYLVTGDYVAFEEEHECTKEDYRARAQAIINYIKGE